MILENFVPSALHVGFIRLVILLNKFEHAHKKLIAYT